MTVTQDRTSELFMRAALSDGDLGYPDDVTFVPADQEWTDRALWRAIHDERRTVVLVGEGTEVLIEPIRRDALLRLLDRLRRRMPVRVAWRGLEVGRHGSESVRVTIGHHPLADLPQSPTLA